MTLVNKTNTRKALWIALFVLATVGCSLLWADIYTYPENTSRTEHIWYEKLMLPFYFTFISNFMAVLAGATNSFGLFKNREKARRQFEIMMATNLIVTFAVYWALIFPGKEPATALGWASNLTIHGIVPILGLVAFIVKYTCQKNGARSSVLGMSLKNLLFPLIWLVVAIIIYFSLGANKDAAIYSFLRFKQNAIWFSCVIVFGIGIAYFGITALMTWFSNDVSKKYKK